MHKPVNLSPAQLSDQDRKRIFGSNVETCLLLLGTAPASLAIRTEIKEDVIGLILNGAVSLSNSDIDAIASELRLNTNDLLTDYGDSGTQTDKLRYKLTQSGKLRTFSPPFAKDPTTPVLDSAIEVTEPPLTATITQPIMEVAMVDIWNSDDTVAVIDGHRFKLRDKEVRKRVGKKIIALKDQKQPDVTWTDILNGRKIYNRAANWMHNVSYGTAGITGTEIESFAEFFKVPVLAILRDGQDEAPASVVYELQWDKDGFIATVSGTDLVFDLTDQTLGQEVVQRIRALCPAETAISTLLDECGIEEMSNWLDVVESGVRHMEEVHIEAFAEFFNITDYSLISGDGLILPEPAGDTATTKIAEILPPEEAMTEVAEPMVDLEPAEVESSELSTDDVESVEAATSLASNAVQVPLSDALQMHFKQLVLADGSRPHSCTSWEALFRATHDENVDWCSVYLQMTDRGSEVLAGVSTLIMCFSKENHDLNEEIIRRAVSLAFSI